MQLTATPVDMIHLPAPMRAVFATVSFFGCLTGRWQRPRDTAGDFPTMSFLDKVHWLYKAATPVVRPEAGRQLDAFHVAPEALSDLLPSGFEVGTRATLVAGGDLMPHPFLDETSDVFAPLAPLISGAGWVSANLEAPMRAAAAQAAAGSTDKAPALAFSREQLGAVVRLPNGVFHHLTLANNHSLDQGAAGLRETTAALAALGVETLGVAGQDQSESTPRFLTLKDISVGVLAFTFGLNGQVAPDDQPHLVDVTNLNESADRVNLDRIRSQIATCRAAGVDLVIAHLHWGLEFELFPTRKQQTVAHELCELGIDLIIGHHPHIIQPVELYRTQRDLRRLVPIFYSLGNLTNHFTAPVYRLGLMAEITLAKGRLDGRDQSFVAQLKPWPVVRLDDPMHRRVTVHPLADLAGTTEFEAFAGFIRLALGPGWV